MARKPTKNLNLPRGMRARVRKYGTYYYLDTGAKPRKEIPLGKDYVEAVRKWAELTKEDKPKNTAITFRYAAECYLVDVLPSKSPTTQKDNLRELAKLYEFFDNPPAPLDEINPVHINQYLKYRSSAKVRANREKALFSHIFNYARQEGLTNKENPCRGVRSHKETGRDIYIDDEILQLVEACAEEPLADAMKLSYLTGQRPVDALAMSSNQIIEGALHIVQTKRGTKLRILIQGELKQLIDKLLKRTNGVHLLSDFDGDKFTKYKLRGAFDRARDRAVIAKPEWRERIRAFQFRDLRAKAATDKDESEDITAAQTLLGHTSPSMTKHYVRNRRGKITTPTK